VISKALGSYTAKSTLEGSLGGDDWKSDEPILGDSIYHRERFPAIPRASPDLRLPGKDPNSLIKAEARATKPTNPRGTLAITWDKSKSFTAGISSSNNDPRGPTSQG